MHRLCKIKITNVAVNPRNIIQATGETFLHCFSNIERNVLLTRNKNAYTAV